MSIEVRTEEGLATYHFNRPEKKNALTLDMRIALGDHFNGWRETQAFAPSF